MAQTAPAKPGAKKPSMAVNGANVAAPPSKLKVKQKDPGQKEIFNTQINDFGQNAFITGVNNLQMGLDVSDNCFKYLSLYLILTKMRFIG